MWETVETSRTRTKADHTVAAQECVAVFQIGARRHYAVPNGLAAIGALARLVTDIYVGVLPWRMAAYLPLFLRLEGIYRLFGRSATNLDRSCVTSLPLFVLRESFRRFHRAEEVSQSAVWARQNRAFGLAACRHIPRNATAVYAFNGAALEIFQEAKRRKVRCVLDQTSAPWRYNRDLLTAERDRWPDWEDSPADLDRSGDMIEREEKEWDLADVIVCGSPFVVEAVRRVGGPFGKCCVITYPTPDSNTLPDSFQRDDISQVINVLYVGTVQLRKGIQYLWESAGRLSESRFRFRAVGPSHMTASAQSKLEERIHCVGAVPRTMVRQHYEWADVVVLPTLSEGSANVCHEALACGRPVITTTAAGLQSKPGVSIVAMQDTDALVHEIRKIANRPTPSASPRGKSVAEYGQEIAEIIAGLE